MDEITNVLEAIKAAIQMEKDGYSFYKKAAAQTTSEMGRSIFESLANDELTHLDVFEKIFDNRLDNNNWTPPVIAILHSPLRIHWHAWWIASADEEHVESLSEVISTLGEIDQVIMISHDERLVSPTKNVINVEIDDDGISVVSWRSSLNSNITVCISRIYPILPIYYRKKAVLWIFGKLYK